MAQYKTGTVSVTNGSATVTGSGTLWSGEIAAGDLFTIVGDNAWYEVASVGSNTSITLSANYAGTTGSGKSYAISRDFTTRLALPYPQKGDIETASIIKRAFEQIDTETNIATANYSATSAPTANDDSGDGYSIGSWWVNVTSDEAYLCVDATVGAAVWTKISVDVPSEIVALLAGQSVSMASLTLSGGTANGVLYLNGSKVATSGSALTFDGSSLTVFGGGAIKGNKNASGQFLAFVAQNSTQNYGTYIDQDNAGSNSWSLFDTTNSQTALRYYPSTSGYWQFYVNNSEAMRLTSTGLGIGTSSPQTRLEANQTGVGSVVIPIVAANQDTSTTGTGAGIGFVVDGVNDVIGAQVAGIRTAGAYHASALAMYTLDGAGGGLLERARIDSSGNLLVGTTSVLLAGKISSVGGASENGGAFQTNAVANNYTAIAGARNGNAGNVAEWWYSASTQVGTITVTASATAYNTSSDYRLKNIDGPLTGSGAFIDALKPKVGTWKADGSKFVGFLAHEVQEVSPGSVVGQKDAIDEDGKPIMQAMEYGSAEFIANIIAELQSLRARVAALES